MLKLELQAHSRLLSAMAVHPTRPLFATAAEDATLAVWQLADGAQEVRHSMPQVIADESNVLSDSKRAP